ncbi:MAG TPA: NAD(P)H-dependent glycerol-3-phosphate dehydrogenase [Candidatus Nanopelagicaceae bacterium]
MARVTVLGTGAWGTTLGQVLCDAGHQVLLWGRNAEIVAEINALRSNHKFLPGIFLPENLAATVAIEEAFNFGEAIILAIPSQTLRENLRNWRTQFPSDRPIISTLKGIEAETMSRMTEVIEQELGTDPSLIGLITGPNLAGELSLREPAGAVAAASSPEIQSLIIDLFTTPYFRIYPSDDLVGCELAGAAKSVVALAVGMTIGMNLGENTQAMIITRGLSEVARFGQSYGANPLTFLGLAGMGDIVASCGSALSRNRQFGEAFGRTGTIEAAKLEVAKTVEGVASAPAIRELAHRVGVEVPIIEVMADAVTGSITPAQAMERLMLVSTLAEL